jgi:cholesterol transport system auxiliary component
LLSPPAVETKKAVLDQMPASPSSQQTHGATLLVFLPDSLPVFDTTQMAYQNGSHEIAYFSQREWVATPARMLYPLLMRTMENTHYFRAVLMPPYTGRYTYALHTQIIDLVQDFSSEVPALVLSVRFQLMDYATNRVIGTKEISLRQPMQRRTSDAGVAAANEATAKALQEMTGFVFDTAERASPPSGAGQATSFSESRP